VSRNYVGFGVYGAYYPGAPAGVTISNNTIFDYTNPIYSTNAWKAFLAAGLQTTDLVVSTNAANIPGSATGSTTLYGNRTSEHLCGAMNETLFVGGAGVQYLRSGAGANIFKYLAFSDSTATAPDLIGNFDPAKDVIDLSWINANPTSSSVKNFTFIGSGAFTSAGAQVRVVQDAALDETLVEATMTGDTSPDLEIRVGGLLNLTAANFALTASQSAADIAAGAALKVARTVTGGANEYACTNVIGRDYGSYEDIFTSSNTLAAQAFNYSGGSDAVTLLGNDLTYSDGGSAESITTGSATFSIGPHTSETINATGSSGDTFAFHSGFGSATITDLSLSSNDILQLDKSMSTYTTSTMTQTLDLAALLAHATSSASGLVIVDTHGDHLALSGVTASALSTNPAQVKFV
jgi:hypothetical protein